MNECVFVNVRVSESVSVSVSVSVSDACLLYRYKYVLLFSIAVQSGVYTVYERSAPTTNNVIYRYVPVRSYCTTLRYGLLVRYRQDRHCAVLQ